MAAVTRFVTARWKALAVLLAGGTATEVVTVVWPGNEVAAAIAVLLTALAVHQVPNRPPQPARAVMHHPGWGR